MEKRSVYLTPSLSSSMFYPTAGCSQALKVGALDGSLVWVWWEMTPSAGVEDCSTAGKKRRREMHERANGCIILVNKCQFDKILLFKSVISAGVVAEDGSMKTNINQCLHYAARTTKKSQNYIYKSAGLCWKRWHRIYERIRGIYEYIHYTMLFKLLKNTC